MLDHIPSYLLNQNRLGSVGCHQLWQTQLFLYTLIQTLLERHTLKTHAYCKLILPPKNYKVQVQPSNLYNNRLTILHILIDPRKLCVLFVQYNKRTEPDVVLSKCTLLHVYSVSRHHGAISTYYHTVTPWNHSLTSRKSSSTCSTRESSQQRYV